MPTGELLGARPWSFTSSVPYSFKHGKIGVSSFSRGRGVGTGTEKRILLSSKACGTQTHFFRGDLGGGSRVRGA